MINIFKINERNFVLKGNFDSNIFWMSQEKFRMDLRQMKLSGSLKSSYGITIWKGIIKGKFIFIDEVD